MKANRKLLLGVFAFAAIVVFFVPLQTAVVPPVRVQVFDEAGKPASGVRVEQQWDYTALDSEPQQAVLATDSDGYVVLPKRSVRISLARRTLGFLATLLPLICGYGFGPAGSISAYGPDPRAWDIVVCDLKNPTPRPLRLTRWDLVAH